MIADINKLELNVTGWCQLYFVPLHGINSITIPNINDLICTAVSFKTNYKFFKMYFTRNAEEEEYELRDTANNKILQQVIVGFIPNNTLVLRSQLQQMQQMQFLVIIKDKSNNNILFGTPDTPCSFNYNFSNKQNNKGFDFEFVCNNTKLPYNYTGLLV